MENHVKHIFSAIYCTFCKCSRILYECIQKISIMSTENIDKEYSYSSNKLSSNKKREHTKNECPTLESCSPNWSSFCCRGVLSGSVAAISSLIFPISVCTPVATTTPIARPAAIFVPYKNTHLHDYISILSSMG